jgi:hypothetical protein
VAVQVDNGLLRHLFAFYMLTLGAVTIIRGLRTGP